MALGAAGSPAVACAAVASAKTSDDPRTLEASEETREPTARIIM
jgi:hypothetical protein